MDCGVKMRAVTAQPVVVTLVLAQVTAVATAVPMACAAD